MRAMTPPPTDSRSPATTRPTACSSPSPLALLIGFALDQQVTVQKAFSGPLELQRRIGHLDAATIAAMDPEELDTAFRTPPALHRFPGTMAGKTQALCAAIVERLRRATRAGSGRRPRTARISSAACSSCPASATMKAGADHRDPRQAARRARRRAGTTSRRRT